MIPVAALVAQGIPLAPPLGTRLIALVVVEVVLLALFILLYIRWDRFKNEPLDEWWTRRLAQGISAKSSFAMEESEQKRLAAAVERPPAQDGGPAPGG